MLAAKDGAKLISRDKGLPKRRAIADAVGREMRVGQSSIGDSIGARRDVFRPDRVGGSDFDRE